MNWDAIGAVSELIGAVAVVATPTYLGLEARLNQRALKAATYEDIYRDLQQNFNTIEVEILRKLQADEELTELEQLSLNRWRGVMFRMFET